MSAEWGGRGHSVPPGVPTLSERRLNDIERDVSRELLMELVALFVSDVTVRLERLSDAVSKRNAQRAASFVHALKGAAASIGVLRLHALAQRLEEHVERADWAARDQALARLASEFPRARAMLGTFGADARSGAAAANPDLERAPADDGTSGAAPAVARR
jgi:HPt (histidine-containing phosphotransfer) domain-containing protein